MLNLFLFNMLILVLGDNLLITFVGWEGVGLCSYLLIGFGYEKKSASGESDSDPGTAPCEIQLPPLSEYLSNRYRWKHTG